MIVPLYTFYLLKNNTATCLGLYLHLLTFLVVVPLFLAPPLHNPLGVPK